MRIAFVHSHYDPYLGGVESHMRNLGERMARAGHDIDVYVNRDERSWPAVETMGDVTVHRFDMPVKSRNLGVAPGMLTTLRNRASDYDIVHAHGFQTIAPLFTAWAHPRKFVFTPHYHGTGHSALRAALHKPYDRLFGRQVFRAAHNVICVARPESELLVRDFPAAGPKLTIIPNGYDDDLLRSAEPFNTELPVILGGGRLEDYKRVSLVVETAELLTGRAQMRISGSGSLEPELQALAAAQRARGADVQLLGRVDTAELYRWFASARVFVTMSIFEAHPVSVVEAIASGAYVVASDIPAHRAVAETFPDVVALVPVHATSAEIAEAIKRALDQTSAHDAKPLNWNDVVEHTLAVYAS